MERIKELTPVILMGMFGVVLILIIPSQIKQASSSIIGPQFVPYLAAGIIVLSSLSSILHTLITKKENEGDEEKSRNSYLKVILTFFCIILWILLFPILGYIISTLLITALACVIFGDRNIIRISLVSILFSVGSYYTFSNILQINLS